MPIQKVWAYKLINPINNISKIKLQTRKERSK